MKIVPTFIHGILDYIGGIALFLAPEIFQFSDIGGAAVLVPRILGAVILAQSLMTNYETGVFKVVPMRIHLMNDYVASLFLAISPWIFGFANAPLNVWLPHVVAGVSVFALTAMTRTVPYHEHASGVSRRTTVRRKSHA